MSYEDIIQSVSIRYTDKINKACRYLFPSFNMNHFWYCKIDNQGNYSFLGSHAGWCEHFATEKLYLKYSFIRHPKHQSSGVHLIKNPENPLLMNVLTSCKMRFDMQCLLSVINKDQSGIEEFGFACRSASDEQISLLINSLPLFRLFVKNFKEKNPLLLSKMHDHQINIGKLIGPTFYNSASETLFDHQALFQKMQMAPDFSLSESDIQVIKLLLDGFSAGQISPRVFRSVRTVEHRIERLKEKLNCFSKAELIQKARELDEFGFLN